MGIMAARCHPAVPVTSCAEAKNTLLASTTLQEANEEGPRLKFLTRISQMGCRRGDAAERIAYDDQCVVVSSVVPAWLIQRVNREKPLSSSGSIAGSSWNSTAPRSRPMPGCSPFGNWTMPSA